MDSNGDHMKMDLRVRVFGRLVGLLSVAKLDGTRLEKAQQQRIGHNVLTDLVFGSVFERGRNAAISAAERIGGRILEVGVGTGISLPDYARANHLIGVDISLPMLLPGIKLKTSPTDYYPIQAMRLQKFNGETWELFGDTIGND